MVLSSNTRPVPLLAAAALALATLAAPLAAAQVGTFGSQVKVGDLDFLPVTKKASFMPAVYWFDGQGTGSMKDLCVLAGVGAGGVAGADAGVDAPPAAYRPSA